MHFSYQEVRTYAFPKRALGMRELVRALGMRELVRALGMRELVRALGMRGGGSLFCVFISRFIGEFESRKTEV